MTTTTSTPTSTATSTPVTAVTCVSHIAVVTPDLDRFRRFYEGVVGLTHGVTMRMGGPPHFRHAMLLVQPGLGIHVIEEPGYDPQAQGIGVDIGQRGRIDHFAFGVPDEAALEQVATRLRAAGASDGVVRSLGPVWSVHATDPDGLQFEVTCTNLSFDAGDSTEIVEEVGVPDWMERLDSPRG